MRDYKKILEGVVDIINNTEKSDIGFANICTYIGENYPELAESEDERIKERFIKLVKMSSEVGGFALHKWEADEMLAWLEKQVPVDKEKVLIGARKDVALSIINYLDNNSVGMCLSNMECEDIEDACVNSKWTKLYNYMKKKLEKQGDDNKEYWRGYREGKQEILDKYAELEKQGEQKSAEFKPLFRVGDVIKPKDPVLGEPRIIKGIHPKFGYDTNNGILDFEFEDNWELVEQKPANKVEPKDYSSIDPHFFKPADKVNSKFRNGQWIVWQDKCYKVNYNGCGYELVDQDGLSTSLEYGTIDENAHIWDITKDAKDGDVLACPNDAGDRDVVFIFKNINSDEGWVFCFCASDANGCFCTNNDYVGNSNSTNISPATKEQCDTLEKTMADAGYTFDFEKKELKKIEPKPADKEMKELLRTEYEKGRADAIAEMQKPWSEEDELKRTTLIDVVKKQRGSAIFEGLLPEELTDWLESLRPQNRWKPTKEQLYWLKQVIPNNSTSVSNEMEVLSELYRQLKAL